MIKAKDLLDFLCNKLNIRFFSGTPCSSLINLYSAMDKNLMHYVPAANEQIACSMVNGSYMVNNKSALIVDPIMIEKMDFSFNLDNKLPLLIITGGSNKPKCTKDFVTLNLVDDIKKDLSKLYKRKVDSKVINVIYIKDGILI